MSLETEPSFRLRDPVEDNEIIFLIQPDGRLFWRGEELEGREKRLVADLLECINGARR